MTGKGSAVDMPLVGVMQRFPQAPDACRQLLPHLTRSQQEQVRGGEVATASDLRQLRALDALHGPWLQQLKALQLLQLAQKQQQQQQLRGAATAQAPAEVAGRPPPNGAQQQLPAPPAVPRAASTQQAHAPSAQQPPVAAHAAGASHVAPEGGAFDISNTPHDHAAQVSQQVVLVLSSNILMDMNTGSIFPGRHHRNKCILY